MYSYFVYIKILHIFISHPSHNRYDIANSYANYFDALCNNHLNGMQNSRLH